MQRVKQEYLEKYCPSGFDPFAHQWTYGIDTYKCIGCNQCMREDIWIIKFQYPALKARWRPSGRLYSPYAWHMFSLKYLLSALKTKSLSKVPSQLTTETQ